METENHTGISADKPIGPGTRLNDIFEIDEKIATGGMGEVFRGHNITTDEAVAIKIVLGEFARDEKYSNLFFKEARVLSSLNHPSIVRYQIFTIDKAIGRPYLVMEYIEGMSLAERLGHGPLAVDEVRRLTAKLADGLETAHAAGVVHRDLSPDNILLSNNDVALPKLIDFGIARTTQAGQKTFLAGEFAGRTNFASPEQFGLFGGNVEAASDVYSLGLVVINALQGAPLDMNGSQYEMIEKRRRVPDLSHLDADLRPIIEQMLVPDPAARHLTMADVASYFSGRKPLTDLKRPAQPASDSAPDDSEDFWLSAPTGTGSSAPPPELQPASPASSNATIIAGSREDTGAEPQPEKPQPRPANETIIAGAPMPPQPESPPPFALPLTEARPIVWEARPVAAAASVAALPVRKRRAWPFVLTASVLILAGGGAGAIYSGALKNVLPPELDALLHGKFTGAKKTEQVVQDDLPDLTAQPDKTVKNTEGHVNTDTSVKTQGRVGTTQMTDNVTVKQTTAADTNVTQPSPHKDSTRLKPADSASKQNEPLQNAGKKDKQVADVANATSLDTSNTEVVNSDTSVDVRPRKDAAVQQTQVKPVIEKTDQSQSADTEKNKADVSLLPDSVKDDTLPKQSSEAGDTVRPQSTVTTVTQDQTTAQKTGTSPDRQEAETSKDDSSLGDILPPNEQNTVAQDKQSTDTAAVQSSDKTSAEPKQDNKQADDTTVSADVTTPASADTSKQASDQTSGRHTSPVVEKARTQDSMLIPQESVSTAGEPVDVKKADHTAQVDQKPSETIIDHAHKDGAETQVATTVTPTVRTQDAGNDKNEEANNDLPGGLLPSETDVEHTSTEVTPDNAAQTVHDEAKPAETADSHSKTGQASDTAASEKTTGLTGNKVGAAYPETKPSDAIADDSQQPASDKHGKENANTDNNTQPSSQATTDTAETTVSETTLSDTKVENGLPADSKSHVDERKNNSVDTEQIDNGGQSTEPVKDQSTQTDIAMGEPTTEMKHPEIAVDEGLAKRASWVAGFEAGDCFFARMTTNVASAAGITAIAAESRPFYALNDSFTSTFGLEPALRGVPIDKRQCAVTPLLRQLRQAPNEALDLKLFPADEVVSGEPLSVHLDGIGRPFLTVYLIDNDGRVYDLSKDIRKKTGSAVELDYRDKEAKSKAKTFKILLLIGSDKPLAIDFPGGAPPAKNIVPEIAKAINLQQGGIQYAYGFFKVVPKAD